MKKFILVTATAITLSGCVVGPPNYDERDRRAYNSLEDANHHDDYDRYHNWRDNHDHDDRDDEDDYNPHDGHDRWVHHNN